MTRKGDIERLLRAGHRVRAQLFDVRWSASAIQQPRVALVVPKHGHTAVSRNRLKRRLRELVRRELLPSPDAVDVLFRARPTAYDADFASLETDVVRASNQVRAELRKADAGRAEQDS